MKEHIKNYAAVIISIFVILIIIAVPTGFEGAIQFKDAIKCKVRILNVDNSRIIDTGLIRSGQQVCNIEFLNGKYKGQKTEGWNMLNGSLEQDKLFVPEDKALAVVHWDENKIISVNLIDHYRINSELILIIFFALFLIFFAKETGIKAVLSFILTVLVIWKLLVPMYLKGFNPSLAGLCITAFLTFSILALVYGFDKRLIASFSGAMLGIIITAILSIICTKEFKIHGAVMAYSESLLYSGYQYLNLTRIFMSGICVGASGAETDLCVDITSAVQEVVRNCPNISRKKAIKSGITVARAAMGTMTTTLLLAYSGSSVALLMTFMAQGTPIINMLNYKYIAAEIIDTIAGSFGLATAAPFTALIAGLIIPKKS